MVRTGVRCVVVPKCRIVLPKFNSPWKHRNKSGKVAYPMGKKIRDENKIVLQSRSQLSYIPPIDGGKSSVWCVCTFILRHLINITNPTTVDNYKSTENPKDAKCMIMMETINFFIKAKGLKK